jgi:SOS response associated peptidase (SRAP)
VQATPKNFKNDTDLFRDKTFYPGVWPGEVKGSPEEVARAVIDRIKSGFGRLLAEIHDRMPVILAPSDYVRWLGKESDPRDLMRPFPADLMRMLGDFDAGQQARERRSLDCRADRSGSGRCVRKQAAARPWSRV